MSLAQATLETQLTKLIDQNSTSFIGHPITNVEVASNWSTALDTFWSTAVDIAGNTLISTNKAGIESALLSIKDPGTEASIATAFCTEFTNYFLGMSLSITTLPPNGVGGNSVFSSVVTNIITAVDSTKLYNSLLSEFQILTSNATTKITGLANAFFTGSLSVITAVASGLDTTPSPNGPLPTVYTGFLL